MEKRIKASRIETVTPPRSKPASNSLNARPSFIQESSNGQKDMRVGSTGFTFGLFKIWGWAFLALIVWAMIAALFDSDTGKTDGVYESALEKLDEGIPLNEREAKRMEDLINYDTDKRAKEIERKHRP